MKRLAAKVRPIPSASLVRPAGRTAALRPIADHVRKDRLSVIADLAHKATAARVRRGRDSQAIVLARRPAKPFATPPWRQDQAAPAPAVRPAEGVLQQALQRPKSPRPREALRRARMTVGPPPSLWMMKKAHVAAAQAPRRRTPPRPCPAPRVSRSAAKAD